MSLSAPAHPRWLLLPLEGDVDEAVAAHINAMVGEVTNPGLADFVDETVAKVAGVTRLVRREAAALWEHELVITKGAWLLMQEPNLWVFGPVATLQVRHVSPADSDDDVIAAATDVTGDHHGSVDVETIETASGRALSVRYRPVVEVDDVREVHEHRVVLWPRRHGETTLELSLYVTDLIEGGLAAEPFLELARSIDFEVKGE